MTNSEVSVTKDHTLAGDIARAMFDEAGGKSISLSTIYEATDDLSWGNPTTWKATIRATLQSACESSAQFHGDRVYFENPSRGVWRLNKSTAAKLRRASARKKSAESTFRMFPHWS